MGIPQNSDNIGDFLRLKGLKTLSQKRKILPEADYWRKLDDSPEDLGTSQSPIQHPLKNLPQSDLGGELTAQSYDVRANQVAPQAPPIETQQVDETEGLPPVSASQQESMWTKLGRGISRLGNLGSPVDQLEKQVPYEPSDSLKNADKFLSKYPEKGLGKALKNIVNPPINQNALVQAVNEGFSPKISKEFPNQFPEISQENVDIGKSKQVDEAALSKAIEEPYTTAVSGATDAFVSDPEKVSKFEADTGIEFSPQVKEETQAAERVMSSIQSGQPIDPVDEQAKRLEERILADQATDMDKYYIGLALLMPLVVAGVWGKEAGLGALQGTAEGLSNISGRKQQNILKNEELLSDVNKARAVNQGRLGEANAKREQEIAFLKSLPAQNYQNPKTGNQEEIREILPGLWLPENKLTSEKQYEHAQKEAKELSNAKSSTDDLSGIASRAIDIASRIDDDTFSKIAGAITKNVPGTLSKISQDIEWEGKKQNAGTLLNSEIGAFKSFFAAANKLGQLDAAAQRFLDTIISNPTQTLATKRDFIGQMERLRDITQKGFSNKVKNAGFIPELATEEHERGNKNLSSSLNNREMERRADYERGG